MIEHYRLQQIAYKSERAASRRLASAEGLSDEQALRRTLERAAGQAGLAALVEARSADRQAQAKRDAARDALRAQKREQQARRHDGAVTAWRAWFDGSARPNPGRCGIGARLEGPDGTVEISQAAGHGNSSEAEYRALIALLEAAVARGVAGLTVYGDSQVVIGDVTGPDLLAAPSLLAYRSTARALMAQIDGLALRWVPRHKNSLADALSQRAFDLPTSDTDATELS
ncbi:ribonuclease HI family protein [Massilia norwichensis]|uniref:Ribonuclease HI family protein n=1 Tax=Massilia norwichensis TaxID=1442366 RepID=A0ABT2AE32_9BURK|nr:ribonuclease HI family protein [Massilia norwichensis]MCS0592461.1 ribonuclease HI family protein [Massilia norwichensis]